jgi:hypothetical protein
LEIEIRQHGGSRSALRLAGSVRMAPSAGCGLTSSCPKAARSVAPRPALSAVPGVKHLQKPIDQVNEKLARVQTIKKFSIVPNEFSSTAASSRRR